MTSTFPLMPVVALDYYEEENLACLWVVQINAELVREALKNTNPHDLVKSFPTYQRAPAPYARIIGLTGQNFVPSRVLSVVVGPNWKEIVKGGV